MILVVGGTGRLGGSIARALLDGGKAVRVLVRDGSSFNDARAETVRGDLKDLDSLRTACGSVDVVVTTANAIAPRQAEDTIEDVDRLGNRASFVNVRITPTGTASATGCACPRSGITWLLTQFQNSSAVTASWSRRTCDQMLGP